MQLWARLESATATTIRFLESAAKGAAEDGKGADNEDKKARKAREKRRKVRWLIGVSSHTTADYFSDGT